MNTEARQEIGASFEAYNAANPVYAYAQPVRSAKVDAFEMVLDDRAGWHCIRERARYRHACVRSVARSVKEQIQRALRAPYITDYTVF